MKDRTPRSVAYFLLIRDRLKRAGRKRIDCARK